MISCTYLMLVYGFLYGVTQGITYLQEVSIKNGVCSIVHAACKHNIHIGSLLPGSSPPEISQCVHILLVPTQQAMWEHHICCNGKVE